ncbi:hypothetical protein HPB51_025691 [Rhipicephalus microplus]|uniref:Tick transposon n=1 Tax=Rhipicephalus microplus TaxID=6941 RepID=A0A9J6EPM8_RHIMP|nr:hypothetical protein HPB51_025691 [Rhipicephalus microplus]
MAQILAALVNTQALLANTLSRGPPTTSPIQIHSTSDTSCSIPLFDGTPQQSTHEWITQVERIAALAHWTPSLTLVTAASRLTGSAKDWHSAYGSHGIEDDTWANPLAAQLCGTVTELIDRAALLDARRRTTVCAENDKKPSSSTASRGQGLNQRVPASSSANLPKANPRSDFSGAPHPRPISARSCFNCGDIGHLSRHRQIQGNISRMAMAILESEPYWRRLLLESWHIHRTARNMNRSLEILPPVYTHVLRATAKLERERGSHCPPRERFEDAAPT